MLTKVIYQTYLEPTLSTALSKTSFTKLVQEYYMAREFWDALPTPPYVKASNSSIAELLLLLLCSLLRVPIRPPTAGSACHIAHYCAAYAQSQSTLISYPPVAHWGHRGSLGPVNASMNPLLLLCLRHLLRHSHGTVRFADAVDIPVDAVRSLAGIASLV